jgi:hypothetical protein
MSQNLLTNTAELQVRLDAARERRRRAVAAESRIRREVADTDRRLAAQRKITLGAALLRAVEGDGARHLEALRRLVSPHVTREVDRRCLEGTPFEFAASSDGGAS